MIVLGEPVAPKKMQSELSVDSIIFPSMSKLLVDSRYIVHPAVPEILHFLMTQLEAPDVPRWVIRSPISCTLFVRMRTLKNVDTTGFCLFGLWPVPIMVSDLVMLIEP